MLIEYLRALEAAFAHLVDDFVAARMDSVHHAVEGSLQGSEVLDKHLKGLVSLSSRARE